MNNVIQSIVSIGGFGYLNYYVFNRLNDYSQKTDKEITFQILLFSSLDYTLFLLVSHFIKNTISASILTIILAAVVTCLLPWLMNRLYQFINWLRKENALDDLAPVSVYDIMRNDSNKVLLFIFSTEDNSLIASGERIVTSGEREEMSLILVPFIETERAYRIKTEEELNRFFEEERLNPHLYLNLEKKIKIYYYEDDF